MLTHDAAWPQIGILLVVAGYQHYEDLSTVDAPGLRQHFEVNAIAPLLAVQALRGNLTEGSKVLPCLVAFDTCFLSSPAKEAEIRHTNICARLQVVFLASKMGSIGDGRTGGGLVRLDLLLFSRAVTAMRCCHRPQWFSL